MRLSALQAVACLAGLCSGAKADELFVIPVGAAAIVQGLDTWSRVELSLRPSPGVVPSNSPSMRDFRNALLHARGRKVAEAPSLEAYAEKMSLREATTFKGFVYEQSLVRGWNAKVGSERFRIATHGDRFVDIVDTNPRTHTARRLQAYGGKHPVAALEKLFGSDKEADKLIVTRDVYERITTHYRRAVAKWQQVTGVAEERQAVIESVEKELRPLGLKFDPETGNVSIMSDGQRVNLGPLGSSRIDAALKKLIRDKQTSRQVARNTVRAIMESDPQLNDILQQLGTSKALLDSVVEDIPRQTKAHQIRLLEQRARAGDVAARRALRNANRQFTSELERYLEARRIAILSGAKIEDIQRVTEQLKASFGARGEPEAGRANALTEAAEAMEKVAKDAQSRQVMVGRALVGAMTIVGAVVHFAVDHAVAEKDLSQWVREGNLTAWAARAGVGFAAYEASRAAESFVVRQMLAQGAKEGVSHLSVGLLGRIAGGGVAGALFVAGESLIQVCVYHASLKEAAAAATQTAVVIAVSEGAVVATTLISEAAGFGAIGGPFGIAISIGATAIYLGGSHAWHAQYEYAASNRVFEAKAEAAQAVLDRWAEKTISAMGGHMMMPR